MIDTLTACCPEWPHQGDCRPSLPDCGNAHARLRADDMAWSRAPRVGLRSTPDTSPVVLDVRVCPTCEEHVAREVVVEPEKPTLRVRTLDELEAERTER